MSKLLESILDKDELTPAFSTPTKTYSKEALKKFPCLVVNTSGSVVEKVDNLIKINRTTVIDISNMSLRELCSTLLHYDISVGVVEDEKLLDLPALMLADISNNEVHTAKLTITPFPLSRLNHFKNSGIAAKTSTVRPIYCLNTLTKERMVAKHTNGRLFVKDLNDEFGEVYYAVFSSDFIWFANLSSVVTSSKEFISKYIGATDAT